MIDPFKLYELTDARAWRNHEALQIALGHMRNAIIDLETGETKATAIRTLERELAAVAEKQEAAA
jgi:hypothetical protein